MIGPRPEQPAYVAMLQESIDFYNTRLSVRPGLTGWAQVNTGYGDGFEGAREKLSYDLYYIKQQSPPLDMLIIARTLFAAITERHAATPSDCLPNREWVQRLGDSLLRRC